MQPPRASHRFAFPAMVLGSITLGIGPWMVRLADVGPLASGFWRTALATPILLLMMPLARQPVPRLGQGGWIFVLIAGAAFSFDLATWHLGIVRTTLANATLFGNTTSFIYAAWGFAIARQLPDRRAAMALALAFAGVALLMGRSYQLNPQHLGGDLLCIAAAGFYTVYLIAIGQLRDRLSPLSALALPTVIAATVSCVIAMTFEQSIWPANWIPLIVLAVTCQLLGQGLLVYAVGHLQPVVVGLCLLIQPVISAAIGWVAYEERLAMPDFIGALMIGAALILVRREAAPTAKTD